MENTEKTTLKRQQLVKKTYSGIRAWVLEDCLDHTAQLPF